MAKLISSNSQPLRPLAWASATFLGGVLLHVDRVPVWATAAALICAAWRILAAVRPIRVPGRNARVVLTLALVAAVLARFHTLNGLAAGTALLVVMGAIKLLEIRARRDLYIVIGAALALLLAACLDRQDLLRLPLYVLHVWLCCTALALVAHPASAFASRAAAALAGRGLLLAAPLALILFVSFPRLPGAFWVLPKSDEAMTGLDDTMSPGSISRLTSSYEPAFRVYFDGPPPPPQERYWRGPVLHDFDGFTWRAGRGQFYRQPPLEYLGPAYRYRISLEPHARRWWYALDTVTGPPRRGVFFTYDYQLLASEPVTEPISYEAVSHTRTRTREPLSPLGRRYETQLPENRNPRTYELARKLRASAGSDEAFVQRALDMFRTGGFEYSLTPPRLGLHSVDDFLFSSRSGFCGHYASAFATLMRAGGVPARVVTGYHGGEWNPIGGYFIVRQSDAHAWTEVWIEGQGWVRVDPTAVVEPERLSRGLADVIPEALSAPTRLVRETPWLARTALGWDAINAWWNDQIVRFNFESQLRVLDSLGFDAPEWQHLGWGLALGLTAWLLWLAWHVGRTGAPPPPDRIGRAYLALCRKLERAGVPRAPYQGPLAYADVVRLRRPDIAGTVHELLDRYARLRYGPPSESTRQAIESFERAVARLRIPPAA